MIISHHFAILASRVNKANVHHKATFRCDWSDRCRDTEIHLIIFTKRCYASAVYAVVMCLPVCHKPALYQNGLT